MSKITVIIPIYNSEFFLNRCLDSVIKQSFTDLEIILVNDGSTDNSLKICEEYKKVDPRILLIDKKNGGVSSARNIALEKATGKYIGFVDSDDEINKLMYEKMHDAMESSSADLVLCDYIRTLDGNVKEFEMNLKKGFYNNRKDLDDILLDYVSFNSRFVLNQFTPTKLFKTSIIKEHKLKFHTSLKVGEDHLFTAQYIALCKGIYSLQGEKLYNYIINNDSATASYNENLYKNLTLFNSLLHDLDNISIPKDLFDRYVYSGFIWHLHKIFINELNKNNNNNLSHSLKIIKSALNEPYAQKAINYNALIVPKKYTPYLVLSKINAISPIYFLTKIEYLYFKFKNKTKTK